MLKVGRFIRVIVMAIAAIAFSTAMASAQNAPLRKLKVVFAQAIPLPPYSFLYVGTYLGEYKKEGLEVEYLWAQNSTIAIQQLVSGNADIFVGAYDSILIRAAAGEDLGLQAVYSYQRGNQSSVIVLKTSPISKFADLKGKIIGVPTLASGYTLNTIKAGLRADGVDPQSVQMVAVGIGLQAANALISGRVDAIAQVDTSVGQIVNAGVDIRKIPNPPSVANISAMITAKKEFIEKNSDVIGRYLRGITKGNIFFTTNPEASVRIAWELYPEIKPTNLPEAEALKQGVALIEARAANQSLGGGDVPVWGAASDREWANFIKFLDLDPKKLKDKEYYLTSRFLKQANAFDQAEYQKWAKDYKFTKK
jgi:NitT/TauT family transport system substrate-binding protein